MPEELDEQADTTVRRLLYENWDPTNTESYNPRDESETTLFPLNFGTYDADLGDPQVTLAQTQGEFTVGGNQWSGMNGATGEMNQHRRGMVAVICWATAQNDYANDVDADSLVSVLREEIERIIGDFTQGPETGANAGVIHSLSIKWNGRHPKPQSDATNITWQSQLMVTYEWTRET